MTAGSLGADRSGTPAGVAAFDQKTVPNPEARKIESYPWFDWLRFVFAAVVVVSHEGLDFGPINGGLAVAAFLALSGWLIGGILLRSATGDLPRFFFNRATRIWIPYLITFALLYGLAAVREGVSLHWLKYAFYDLTFTHYTWTIFPRAGTELPLGGTGNHFWSISIEEQFYLFAPLLMFVLPWGKRLIPWLVVAAILLAIGSRFAPIALGLCAAVLQRDHGDWHLRGLARVAVPAAAAASFAILWRWEAPQTQAVFSALLILAAARPGPRSEAGLFLGAISFPLYLNHWIGAFAINAAMHFVPMPVPLLARKIVIFFAGLAVAIASWALIDRNVMAYRARFFTRERGRILAIVAYALLIVGLTGGLAIRLAGG